MSSDRQIVARYLQSRTASAELQGATRLPNVVIDGMKCKWKQAKKPSGRAGIGDPPQHLQPWKLLDSDDHLIAQIEHTHGVPSYVTPTEAPAWKVYVRVDGKGYTLKGRWADPNVYSKGDDNNPALKAAAEAAVKAYQNLKQQSQDKTAK